jgi:hypothetical protein
MPRKSPVQNSPVYRKKPSAEFKIEKDFEYSCSVPCINPRCPDGFMFLVVATYGEHTASYDELECFVCRRTRKLGLHNPSRAKPTPIKKSNDSRKTSRS